MRRPDRVDASPPGATDAADGVEHQVDPDTTLCRRCGAARAALANGSAPAGCAGGDNTMSLLHHRSRRVLADLKRAFDDRFDDDW